MVYEFDTCNFDSGMLLVVKVQSFKKDGQCRYVMRRTLSELITRYIWIFSRLTLTTLGTENSQAGGRLHLGHVKPFIETIGST